MKKIFCVVVTLCCAFAILCTFGCSGKSLANEDATHPSSEIIAEFTPSETTAEIIGDNIINFWKSEWKEEFITNKAGKEIRLYYPENAVLPEEDVDVLAKVLRCEGGTFEEKTRIAQLLSWRRGNDKYPDTIKDIVRLPGDFAYYPEFWNTCEPFEEDYKIAEAALESTERPEYVHYFLRYFYENEFGIIKPEDTVYKTENFVFYN